MYARTCTDRGCAASSSSYAMYNKRVLSQVYVCILAWISRSKQEIGSRSPRRRVENAGICVYNVVHTPGQRPRVYVGFTRQFNGWGGSGRRSICVTVDSPAKRLASRPRV